MESNHAKLPFRAVCKFAFGGIDLRIYRLFILALDLLNLQPFGVASFFPGAPLDVCRAFSPLSQPLAYYDWGEVLVCYSLVQRLDDRVI